MKKSLWLLLFLTSIISCYVAPVPVYRLQRVSEEGDLIWLHGKEYVRLHGKDTDCIIAFDHVKKGLIYFDVGIVNLGNESITVSSDWFKGYFRDKQNELIDTLGVVPVDPEAKLIEIDMDLSRENARYSEENGMKAISSLFGIVDDVASVGEEKSDEEIEQEEQEDIADDLRDIKDDHFHGKVITNLTHERNKWANAALRKTTLPPNHSTSGKISFPLDLKSHYLEIVYKRNNENLKMLFRIDKFINKKNKNQH